MISSKKLMKMAQKWRNLAILGRRRITFSRTSATSGANGEDFSTSSVVKGHVIVYSVDGKRFAIPLAYLDNGLVRELLRMAEEEYGLPSHGPLILPCQSNLMEYAMSLIHRRATEDLEKAFLLTISTTQFLPSSCIHHGRRNSQTLIYGY